MAQILRPSGMLSGQIDFGCTNTDALERRIIAETVIREEGMASVAEEQKVVSNDMKALGRNVQAINTKLGAMKEDMNCLKVHNGSFAERVASAEKLLKQMQEDVRPLRGSFDECCSAPIQQVDAKVTARADKLEKQLKVHREETWSRLADIENHCKSQEQKFHAEQLKKVGRRELEESVEDLRQQIFQIRSGLCCQLEDIERSLHASIQSIHGELLQLHLQSQLPAPIPEATGVISRPRSPTSKQVTFRTHQGEKERTEGKEILQSPPSGFSISPLQRLQQPLSPRAIPAGACSSGQCPLDSGLSSGTVPISRTPPAHATHDEKPEGLPAQHRNFASGSATHAVKNMQGHRRPASARSHEDGRATHTAKSMQCQLRPSSARTRHDEVRAFVAEVCRAQQARSISNQPMEGKNRAGSRFEA
eukprot:CAMPEP_0172664874 /NCGR_PEP_ID=MMETSP1074-20121228/6886_1 /TAXON_ID=2916 /ORGANISM="Ceratium fusus, Strain PA161109" /LENGTH=419 /DNA_ID=CAMNT_0013481103 /DNA_START=40 /DNA_END=1299 /DNA_ORIENTATION=+